VRLLILLTFLAISACQMMPKRQGDPAVVQDVDLDKQINPSNQKSSLIETLPLMNNGVRSLYYQAKEFYQQNAFDQAIASLERAYEIQPEAPQISQLLAEISLHKGENKQAHYWAGIATKNGPSKGKTCEKSWRILAIAAEKTGYYAHQAKALEEKDKCIVKVPKRY
jgi:tetratricopeptide (TPR) repeat protein